MIIIFKPMKSLKSSWVNIFFSGKYRRIIFAATARRLYGKQIHHEKWHSAYFHYFSVRPFEQWEQFTQIVIYYLFAGILLAPNGSWAHNVLFRKKTRTELAPANGSRIILAEYYWATAVTNWYVEPMDYIID